MKKTVSVLVILLLASVLSFADKKDEPSTEGSIDVKFQILKADNGKPIRNAAVILHPVTKEGWQSRKGYELKTDSEGNTQLTVPYGKVRVQVIAPGFQTYGEDYVFNEPTKEIVIKMNRPKDQYSIYK